MSTFFWALFAMLTHLFVLAWGFIWGAWWGYDKSCRDYGH